MWGYKDCKITPCLQLVMQHTNTQKTTVHGSESRKIVPSSKTHEVLMSVLWFVLVPLSVAVFGFHSKPHGITRTVFVNFLEAEIMLITSDSQQEQLPDQPSFGQIAVQNEEVNSLIQPLPWLLSTVLKKKSQSQRYVNRTKMFSTV